MRTYESEIIDTVAYDGGRADLDRCCKKIMSSKLIISKLLQAVVPEYKNCESEDIIELIGNVAVSETSVDADIAPAIINEANEDNTVNEGKRIYDIKFTARTPDDQQIALIINLEIQNTFNAGYPLIKRAEYYCARLISSQLNTVFTGSEYDKIQKVYSIWICTSPDKAHRNTISHYRMNRYDLAGHYEDTAQDIRNYDLMNVIMICLGESDTKECRGIIRMLHSLLVADISANEKKRIVHEEYGIPMNKDFDREVEDMCNISSLYIDRGFDKGVEQGIAQGIAQGALKKTIEMIIEMAKNNLPVSMIASIAHLSVEETEKIIKENS